MLTKNDKTDIRDIVLDVINEVVMPAFETVATKTDLAEVKNDLEVVKSDLEVVKARLDSVDRKVDRIAAKQINHDDRLEHLESKVIAH